MELFQFIWFKNSSRKNVRYILKQIGKERFQDIIRNNPLLYVSNLSDMYLEYYRGHFYLIRAYPMIDLVITVIDDLELPQDGWELQTCEKQRTKGWIDS